MLSVLLLLCLASINIVLAVQEPLIIIKIEDNKVVMANIIEKNDYYVAHYQDFFEAIEEQDAYYRLKLYAKNKLLVDAAPFPELLIYEFNPSTTKIQIINEKNNLIIFEKEINVCNYNNICEPSRPKGAMSSNYESSLLCSDCKKSSNDNFCEIIHDGVCDPDCNGLEYECDERISQSDGLLDNTEFKCSSQFNGELCKENQECLTESIMLNNKVCCLALCSEKFMLKEELEKLNQEDGKRVIEAEQVYVGKLKKQETANTMPMTTIITVISLITIISLITFLFIKKNYINKKMFAEVNELINNYNYGQIRKLLRKKGYNESQVEKAINQHYNRYKSYYEQQFKQLENNGNNKK